MRYDLGTRRATELKSGEWIISPSVSRDGRLLAYKVSPGDDGYLAVMPLEGGAAQRVASLGAGLIRSLQIHPDGRIFFSQNIKSPDEVWTLENFLAMSKPKK